MLALALALVTLALLAIAAPAGAHTQVQRSVPGPGARVSGVVDHVELTFLDPVEPSVTITVRGDDGRPVAGLGSVQLRDDHRQATVHFDALRAAGSYVVDYRFAAADGDVQRQTYQFTYRPSAADTTDGGAAPTAAVIGGIAVALIVVVGFAVALRRRRVTESDIPDS